LTPFLSENGPIFLFLTCVLLIYISLTVSMSKFIFVLKSGIKCHFGGFLISPCPLMPQWHNARIGFLVTLEIGDICRPMPNLSYAILELNSTGLSNYIIFHAA